MPRYTPELPIRFIGSEAKARLYIPAARGVVGMLQASLQPGVLTSNVSRQVADGVTIYAAFVAGVPHAIIDVRGLDAPIDVTVRARGFLLTPASNDLPGGLGADDVMILEPVDTDDEYIGWFPPGADADTVARAVVSRPYENIYPDGLEEFGNLDWRGVAGSVSWLGPHSRHFHEFALQSDPPPPRVWSRGQLLFDGEAYIVEKPSEPRCAWQVLNAALRRFDGQGEDGSVWLYVFHVEPWDEGLDPDVDDDYWQGEHVLIRYPVDARPGTTWSILLGEGEDAEVLWSRRNEHERIPWHVNASCTAAARVQRRKYDEAFAVNRGLFKYDEVARLSFPDGESVSFASENLKFHPFSDTVAGFTTAGLPVAIDYDGNEEVLLTLDYAFVNDDEEGAPLEQPYDDTWLMTLKRGNVTLLTSVEGAGGSTGSNFYIDRTTRSLLFVDLRIGLVAAVKRTTAGLGGPGLGGSTTNVLTTWTPEVYVMGDLFVAGGSRSQLDADPTDGFITAAGGTGFGAGSVFTMLFEEVPVAQGNFAGDTWVINRDLFLQGAYRALWYHSLDDQINGGGYAIANRKPLRDGRRWWGQWSWIKDRVLVSQVSFGAADFVSKVSRAELPEITGLQGADQRYFPGSIFP